MLFVVGQDSMALDYKAVIPLNYSTQQKGKAMLSIRKLNSGEEQALWQIFFHTVRNINIRDYSQAQVEAWAPDGYDENYWLPRIAKINPFVVVLGGEVVAYADIQPTGYIDHFFCHHQHQGKGIGKALFNHLLETAKKQNITKLTTHASKTAKPFFEKLGFSLIKPQQVDVRGQTLENYVLEKVI
ncbi:MAG: putative acetyltransferase [Phenylobacterium sp.]